MNFLAHFHLADSSPAMLAGSFLGDFCKGRVERFPDVFRAGIRHHRAVDEWVERYPRVRDSRRRLSDAVGRYAGVALDVLHDHFLARNWNRFSEEPLESAVHRYYAALRRHRDEMPERPAWVAERMIDLDWLTSYRETTGIRIALERMSSRLRHDVRLDAAVDALPEVGEVLEEEFFTMFEELKRDLGPGASF